MQQRSIAEARDSLPKLVHAAEQGEVVRLTRRGQAVAVLLAEGDYRRLLENQRPAQNFVEGVRAWRANMIAEGNEFPGDEEIALLNERDRTPARDFSWD